MLSERKIIRYYLTTAHSVAMSFHWMLQSGAFDTARIAMDASTDESKERSKRMGVIRDRFTMPVGYSSSNGKRRCRNINELWFVNSKKNLIT